MGGLADRDARVVVIVLQLGDLITKMKKGDVLPQGTNVPAFQGALDRILAATVSAGGAVVAGRLRPTALPGQRVRFEPGEAQGFGVRAGQRVPGGRRLLRRDDLLVLHGGRRLLRRDDLLVLHRGVFSFFSFLIVDGAVLARARPSTLFVFMYGETVSTIPETSSITRSFSISSLRS